MLAPLQDPYLWIAALFLGLLVWTEVSHRKERVLFKKRLSDSEKDRVLSETRLSSCGKDRQSLAEQLQQAQAELTTARAILNCRGRFIAKIKPLFRKMAGSLADLEGQNKVYEEHLRQLCDELDAEEAAKERQTKTDLTLDVAQIIVAHA